MRKLIIITTIVYISAFLCTGSLVVTNLCAFAVHLLIEAPIIGLVKIVTGKKETTHLAESMTLDRLNCDEVSDA